MMPVRSVLVLSVMFVVLASVSWSQVNVEASIGTMADDNVNNNSLRLADRITMFGLQAGYDWITDRTNTGLTYSGSYNYFGMVPTRTFQYHSAALTYAQLFGEEQQTLWNAGASYGIRSDREEYAFYDHRSFSAQTTVRTQWSAEILTRAGYTFRTMDFSALPAFNYTEHSFFTQASLFLPTRTTVIGELSVGLKLYATANTDSTAAHQGRGRGSSATSAPSVTQATGMIRVGQGISDNTGLSFTGAYQINLQKDVRVLGSDYGLISDDEIFDDHYGYEGPQASVMLTQILPWETNLRLTGSWQRRMYATQAAYDQQGVLVAADRLDTRMALNVQLLIPIQPLGCSIGIAYDHIRNTSNDAFFTYTNNAITLQLSYP